MSWVTDDGQHEGWVGCVVPDGRVSAASGGGNVYFGHGQTEEAIPLREVVGWQVACTCGWRGSFWTRVDDPSAHDVDAFLAYDPDGFQPNEVENAGRAEWQAHVAPVRAVAEIQDAARESGLTSARLEDAIVAARAVGVSWDKIGVAAGMTRQSAHQRWKPAVEKAAAKPDAGSTADTTGSDQDYDGTDRDVVWRRLIDGSRLAAHPMSTPDAMMLGRHIKAALGHLRVAERMAEQAGIDLTVMFTDAPGYELCELFRTAADAVEELDGWAVNNAQTNGGGRATYAGTEHWCPRGGTLPTLTSVPHGGAR